MMLGTLGATPLAAVGYATQSLFVVQSCMVAVGASCVAMMARALGAGNVARARSALATNLCVGLLAFALPALLTTLISPNAVLDLLAAPAEVRTIGIPYFRWTMATSVSVATCQIYEHALRTAKDTRRAMGITALIAVAKLVLNYALIFGHFGLPELGLEGAGMATLGAYTLGALLFITATRNHPQPALRLRLSDARHIPERLRETLHLAIPALGERLAMTVALITYFRFLAKYGVASIAAYNVGTRILAFSWIPGLALSVAASTLVGLALGARDPSRARDSGTHAVRLGQGLAFVLGLLLVCFRHQLSKLFTNDGAVIAALDPFILLLGLGLPLLVTHFTLSGALRGAGDTLSPLYAASVGSWLIRVPLAYLLSQVLFAPLAWVWSVMLLDHLLRAVWLSLSFRYGSWDQRLGDR